jgi:hypothetical protein
MKVVLAPLVGARAALVERQGELVLILDSGTSKSLATALRRVLAPVRGYVHEPSALADSTHASYAP